MNHTRTAPGGIVFGWEPESIVARVGDCGQVPRLPTLASSVGRGAAGFALVSLGGFAPWVLAGRWFYRHVGEAGLYAVCAFVFIGLSGLLLHRLIIGPDSLVRCYKIFSLGFAVYAVAWTLGWMAFRGFMGSVVGLLAGTTAMSAILAWGFKAGAATLRILVVLFVANAAGYFLGEWAYKFISTLKEGNPVGVVLEGSTRLMLAKAAWGTFHGLGFGAGIGFAFHACQSETRRLITNLQIPSAGSAG